NRPQCLLIGPRSTPTESLPGPGHLIVGVRLQPGVAHIITAQPVRRLVDKRLDLTTILGSDGSNLQSRLCENLDADRRINILEAFRRCRLNVAKIYRRVMQAL